MYTSLKLSKLLHENGCELESDMYWDYSNYKLKNGEDSYIIDKREVSEYDFELLSDLYPAYDILNDICVKYAKEFFGEDYSFVNEDDKIATYPEEILLLLQQNKTQEAEDYIWEHCKFNKDNK